MMSDMGDIANTLEYHSFRSTIPLKKIVVDDDHHKAWSLYDAGPRSVRCPLIFFPPASGTADVFFKQILALSTVGYRVIAVDYPVYWTLKEICEGFQKLLDHLQLDRVHIFGASLGGFIAQKFAEHTSHSPRVMSLLVCNSFNDTSIFQQTSAAPTFWMMPALFLKKMVIGSFQKGMVDSSIADSIDFLVDKLDGLSQKVLASRLTLNCMSSYIEPQKLNSVDITIMDVFDECALSQMVKDEMYKCYPNAKRAHLKSGGNFPYLSRSLEVNVFIQVHLQKYEGTKYSAKEEPELSELIQIEDKPSYHYDQMEEEDFKRKELNNQNEEDSKTNGLSNEHEVAEDSTTNDLNNQNEEVEVSETNDLSNQTEEVSEIDDFRTQIGEVSETDDFSFQNEEEDSKTIDLNNEDLEVSETNDLKNQNKEEVSETNELNNESEENSKTNDLSNQNDVEEDSTTNELTNPNEVVSQMDDLNLQNEGEDSKTNDLNIENEEVSETNELNNPNEEEEDSKTNDLSNQNVEVVEESETSELNKQNEEEEDSKINDLKEQELPAANNNNNTDQNSLPAIPNNSLNHSDTES